MVIDYAAGLALIAVVGGALVAGGILMVKRVGRGAIVIGVLGALLLGGVGYKVVTMSGLWQQYDIVWSSPGGGDDSVRFEVRHERLSFDGERYEFRVGETRDELFSLLAAQFPQGSVVGGVFRFAANGEELVVEELPDVQGNAFALDVVEDEA